MKRLFYFLSALSLIIAFAKIGIHLNFWIIPVFFFLLGIAVSFFGRGLFPLYFFGFLLPFIAASPALLHCNLPYNYIASPLFLLSGIIIAGFLKYRKKTGFLNDTDPFIERDFYPYYIFSTLLFISAVFVFLRWSNITLGIPQAVGLDTPVSPPVPRSIASGGIVWLDQRISFAAIFPIVTLFIYFISPYIFFYIKKMKPEEKTLFKWISWGFIISTAFAVMQKTLGHSFLSDRLGKEFKQFNGGFSDFNGLGVFSGIMFLWSTYEIKKKNLYGYITFGVSLAGGILSGSRTMFVFAVAGVLNLLFHALKNKEKQQKIIAGILIVSFIALVIFAGGTLKKRMMGEDWDQKETLFDKVDAVVNGRLKMAVFSLQTIWQNLVPGVGTGNYTFYLAYKNYLPYKDSGKAYLYDLPLNQYLWVFVENGILAFLFFTYFMVTVFRRTGKKLLLGTMLVVLLFNCYFWLPETCLLFWIIAALDYSPPVKAGLEENRRKWKPAVVIMSVSVFIFFNIVSFNALHPASWARKTGIAYDYGFWGIEKEIDGNEFQWTKDRAGVFLELDEKGESISFRIKCRAPLQYLKTHSQKVRVLWKGKLYREFVFTAHDGYAFRIKSEPREKGVMEIIVSPVFNLKKLGITKDTRDLGVILSSGPIHVEL
jgi:hypothetical protein